MRVLKNNLLIQFSVVSFLIMAAVAMVINTVLADRIRSNAVDDLIDEAVGTSLPRVLTVLTPEDLDVPMTGARYDKFHEFVQRSFRSLTGRARIKLWVKNGTVIYSNDRGAVGERYPSEVNLSEGPRRRKRQRNQDSRRPGKRTRKTSRYSDGSVHALHISGGYPATRRPRDISILRAYSPTN